MIVDFGALKIAPKIRQFQGIPGGQRIKFIFIIFYQTNSFFPLVEQRCRGYWKVRPTFHIKFYQTSFITGDASGPMGSHVGDPRKFPAKKAITYKQPPVKAN